MKIAYIHNDKKIGTGADYINDLIVSKLREHDVRVRSFYPDHMLVDTPVHFRGVNNILFFYSLLEKRRTILDCDIIQGTTYTPLAFMRFTRPVVSHFGSTTIGFIEAVPRTRLIEPECKQILHEMRKLGIITETDLKTQRPLHDIVTIEQYAAEKVDAIVATSEKVKSELTTIGIDADKITVIHNAIEDYWFQEAVLPMRESPAIVFLGRLGDDVFTMKIKGLDRLLYLYRQFPDVSKLSIVMSRNKRLLSWMTESIPHHTVESNVLKTDIPTILAAHAGSVLLVTSRYEGFSLSLIEGMSQGLIPVTFGVGVAPEIIINGVNGYIVDSLDEAIHRIELILSDDSLRTRLSLASRETARAFHSEILVSKMIDLYEGLLVKTDKS